MRVAWDVVAVVMDQLPQVALHSHSSVAVPPVHCGSTALPTTSAPPKPPFISLSMVTASYYLHNQLGLYDCFHPKLSF